VSARINRRAVLRTAAAAGAVAAAAQVAVAAHGVGGVPLSVACTDALQALTSGRTASLLRLVAVLAAVWLWSTSIGVKKAWPSDDWICCFC
jgi:anthranilate phosphoribosyltransferase